MQRITTKNFEKQLLKLPAPILKKTAERILLLLSDPFNPLLKNHKLHGPREGYRSINVTADIRVIYRTIDKDTLLFLEIGSHSELYE